MYAVYGPQVDNSCIKPKSCWTLSIVWSMIHTTFRKSAALSSPVERGTVWRYGEGTIGLWYVLTTTLRGTWIPCSGQSDQHTVSAWSDGHIDRTEQWHFSALISLVNKPMAPALLFMTITTEWFASVFILKRTLHYEWGYFFTKF